MNRMKQLKVHVTIQRGRSIPRLMKCKDCCYPPQYHCPFCSPTFFQPTNDPRAQYLLLHLDAHLKRAVNFGEYAIHRCTLQCRDHPHFHCLFCRGTLLRKKDFINHLPGCQQRYPILPQIQTVKASQTKGEGYILSYDTDSDTDSDDGATIADSDDQVSQGASSSQLVTSIVERDTVEMKRSTEPRSSTCHRTVQTNIEKPQDCDEYYFMSLVKMFKKLSPQKKADVRMKIERILFEAEFD